MEISRDALLRVIYAARMSNAMAEIVRTLANGYKQENKLDQIAGALADALCMINGEQLNPEEDFGNSRTYTWLFNSRTTDSEVADEFIRMAENNRPVQPKPNTISKEQFDELFHKNGGYMSPEGEWK
jgi:hypothetical protein